MIGAIHWTLIVTALLIAVPCIGLTWVMFQESWRHGGKMLLAASAIPLVPFVIAFLLGVRGLGWGDAVIWYLAGLAITCFTAALLYFRRRNA